MQSYKQRYRDLCKTEATIPIFSRDWWMDAVCGEENWGVLLVERNNQIIASMPYYLVEKFGFKYVIQPKLTQTNGIWIKYPVDQRYSKRISYEKEIMNEIIIQIEQFHLDYFDQSFHYSFSNWQPFYWKGFQQTTNYTYVIENINSNDLTTIFSDFSHAKRKNIKTAEQQVKVYYDLEAKDFYENHKMTLAKQGSKISYDYELFKRIYDSSYEMNCGRSIYAIDSENNIHSALFVVWDETSAYDLISTIDPDFRSSGSASLLIREIIKFVSIRTKKFDFEGSMIENIADSFRQFGTVQKPYYRISKASRRASFLLQLINGRLLKNIGELKIRKDDKK